MGRPTDSDDTSEGGPAPREAPRTEVRRQDPGARKAAPERLQPRSKRRSEDDDDGDDLFNDLPV